MTTRFPARGLAAGLLLVALGFTATGCKGEKPTATVSGTVKYNGKPLNAGSVNFISSTGSGGQGVLDENGNYKIEGALDVGDFKVYLSPPVPGQFQPGVKVAKAPKFEVAPKYQQPHTSGLTTSLKPGPNEFPIDLKD